MEKMEFSRRCSLLRFYLSRGCNLQVKNNDARTRMQRSNPIIFASRVCAGLTVAHRAARFTRESTRASLRTVGRYDTMYNVTGHSYCNITGDTRVTILVPFLLETLPNRFSFALSLDNRDIFFLHRCHFPYLGSDVAATLSWIQKRDRVFFFSLSLFPSFVLVLCAHFIYRAIDEALLT